jgi:hypothetical protein
MGSMPWNKVVPFVKDVETTLTRARREAFNEGEYLWDGRAPATLEKLDQLLAASKKKRNGFPLECGCVLDVTGVEAAPEYGLSGPFDDSVLLEVLGSARPSRAVMKAKGDALFERLDRGQYAHVVLFARGKPSHVCFLGMTGDGLSYQLAQGDDLE